MALSRDEFGNVWERNNRLFSNESFDQFVLSLNDSRFALITPAAYHRSEHLEDSHRRAATLLLSQLSEKQRDELQRTGKFQVFAGKGLARRRFWVSNNDRVYNVHSWFLRFCVFARDRSLPMEDETLMRKLLIETNPDAFFAVANVEQRQWVDKVLVLLASAGAMFVVFLALSTLYRLGAALMALS